jgi:hypothetical protein
VSQTKSKKRSTPPSIHRAKPYDRAAALEAARRIFVSKKFPRYEFVIASDYRQYLAWCRRYGKRPTDRSTHCYLSDPAKLEGWHVEDALLVFVGDQYWRSPVIPHPTVQAAIQMGVPQRHDPL